MGQMRSLTIRNRVAVGLIIVALLGLGAVLLTVGLALLLGLLVIGGVVGAGMGIYRTLHGRNGPRRAVRAHVFGTQSGERLTGLDPSLEIAAPRTTTVKPADGIDSQG